jgi:phosphoribosyl 1,2-cyclic phosphate phosphodiesterase
MRLTLLGTGNAAGMPLYGCICEACTAARNNPALKRSACSAQLDLDSLCLLLDAGQLHLGETYPAGTLDGILLTHFHPDHVQGLFHLRWGIGEKIPVYCPVDETGCADLFKHPGLLDFQPQTAFSAFTIGALKATPLPLNHSKPTLGYYLEHGGCSIAYLTDTKGLPPETEQFLHGHKPNLMVIDCSFVPGSTKGGHNNVDDVIEIAARTQPDKLVLTHIGHELDIWLRQNAADLPQNISAGFDGRVIQLAGADG